MERSPTGSLTIGRARRLAGHVRVPGDKSISHRALMLGALAVGETRIAGLLEGEDVLATAAALRQLGAVIERGADGVWSVHGVGVGGLLQPVGALDMGNSGTSARLLAGLLATHPVTATLVGDASLSRRPMARVTEPLARMGAEFTAAPDGTLPLTVRGLCPAVPIEYRLPVASAQVKSAVLLAALNTPGIIRVIERVPTRDHTERMLAGFGATVVADGDVIAVTGEAELRPQSIAVPGDASAAAFWMVGASIVPGSDVVIENVGVNPTRSGLLSALTAMGADIVRENERTVGSELVADLRVRHAALSAIELPPEAAPAMIDEYPAFFVAAAFARGRTVVSGAGELRHKESDRIAAMRDALQANGVRVEEHPDGLSVEGSGGEPIAGGGTVATRLDHRIAMSSAVAALHARAPVALDEAAPVATSYPGFFTQLEALRA